MIVLGIDPGFASIGWALVDTSAGRLLDLGVIRTKPGAARRKCDDNVTRCEEIASGLSELMSDHVVEYVGGRVGLVACEAQSWTRNAGSDRGVAMAWGVISTLAWLHRAPLVQITPQTVKHTLTGKRSASKTEIQTEVGARLEGFAELLGGIRAKGQREHASDAAAVALASLKTDIGRVALRASGRN